VIRVAIVTRRSEPAVVLVKLSVCWVRGMRRRSHEIAVRVGSVIRSAIVMSGNGHVMRKSKIRNVSRNLASLR
jgi:hypothetical protein